MSDTNKKSFLLGWKFYSLIAILVFSLVFISKLEPISTQKNVDPNIQKLQESREYFYKICMGGLIPESKGYNDLDKSCKKGMEAIKNPNYKEISPGNWEKHLTGEDEGGSHYAAIAEEQRKWQELSTSPEFINDMIDKIVDLGCKKVKITGSGCDHCMHIMGTSVSISRARQMVGTRLSQKCECPYFFSPDLESRK